MARAPDPTAELAAEVHAGVHELVTRVGMARAVAFVTLQLSMEAAELRDERYQSLLRQWVALAWSFLPPPGDEDGAAPPEGGGGEPS